MRNFVIIFAAACCISTGTFAQSAKPLAFALYPGEAESEAILVPGQSPVRFVSFSREQDLPPTAVFHGRFRLSGTYEVEVFEDGFFVSMWPDVKSRRVLPSWRQRGGPQVIGLSNSSAFAQAVVPKAKLQELRAGKLSSIRGRVTIIAEDYETSIECDAPYFNARYIAIVRPALAATAKPKTVESC